MLQYLHIENIAVIEQANIDFTAGFNVMTGETGAGKSIIIDALFAILGERTSRELIRHGCDKAVVSAAFVHVAQPVLSVLRDLGIEPDESGTLILQRTLYADGHGQVKINMQPANVSALKELGKYLINIHGQHDNQTLLNPQKHIAFVDAYADNGAQRDAYRAAFEQFRSIKKQWDDLNANEQEKRKRAGLLQYQINEINEAEISPGEAQKLKEYITIQHKSERICALIKTALVQMRGAENDETLSAVDLMRAAEKSLLAAANELDKPLSVCDKLSDICYALETLLDDADALLESTEYNPTELEKAENRLDLLQELCNKYGGSEETALQYCTQATAELQQLEYAVERRGELEKELETAETDLIAAGQRLSESRRAAAEKICTAISNELTFLDFNNARFVVDMQQSRYTKNGCDSVEFYISANAGEEPKPLAKVASGGELSRIMLAIRSVLSLRDDVGTLIFDEIDSGISGNAAGKVALKLQGVAAVRQVICVTHLAQIAAAGHHHLLIEKSVRDDRTFTEVMPLDTDGRVREVARMMSGTSYTQNLLDTAEEMIQKFHGNECK